MEESKINFLIPSSSISSSAVTAGVATNFVINPICPLSPTSSIANFNVPPRQVSITQIYASRKIKHPSFRKRASSGTCPYYIPFRHRQRTKSENADISNTQPNTEESGMDVENINDKNHMEMDAIPNSNNLPNFSKIKLSQLKKSKSMESLIIPPPNSDEKETKVNSSTLEFVSTRIQKLKFNE